MLWALLSHWNLIKPNFREFKLFSHIRQTSFFQRPFTRGKGVGGVTLESEEVEVKVVFSQKSEHVPLFWVLKDRQRMETRKTTDLSGTTVMQWLAQKFHYKFSLINQKNRDLWGDRTKMTRQRRGLQRSRPGRTDNFRVLAVSIRYHSNIT